MRVQEFVVFDSKTGEVVKSFTGRVSRRTIASPNDLINLVAEYLGWTGASATDVERGFDCLDLTRVYPGGNGYRIRATN